MKYDEQGNIREGYEEMTIPSFRIYKKFNNNGFTLVELIAVVVILGLITFIAVPTINHHVENSRKESFIRTLDNYVEAVKYDVLKGKYKLVADDSIKVP